MENPDPGGDDRFEDQEGQQNWSEGDDGSEPLDAEERDTLRQDLIDVEVLKDLLGPRGIKGAVFFCPDCNEDHFLAWDLLAGNLKELLEAGESPIHEPAFDPDPDDYVSWDYATGFLDGYESFTDEVVGEITSKLVTEMTGRDWRPDEIRGLLARLGLESPKRSEDTDPEEKDV